MANEVQVFEMIGGLNDLLPVDFLTVQTLSIDGAASAAFNASTTQVAIVSTTNCVVDFGTAPVGTGNPWPIVAGQIYRFAARTPMKVIAVTGTATAPAVSSGGSGTTADQVQGNVAHDAVDSGSPVKVGGYASQAKPTDVADGDRVNIWVGRGGQQAVMIVSGTGGLSGVNALSSATLATSGNGLTTQAVTYGFDGTNCVKIPGNSSGLYVQSGASQYETVAASQTDQVLGATGAAGDLLERLIIIPATTSPGEVSIEDGATNIIVFAGGASSVADLKPIVLDIGIRSTSGGWEITTGANVSAIGVGRFT